MKKMILVTLAVLMLTVLFGCSGSSGKKDQPLKIAYISKMLTHPWFIAEDNGLRDAAAKLGVEYFSIDANLDDEACDAAIEAALAQGIKGLAICITNQGNGPALAIKCRERGIALITVDDNIVDENGSPVPHVGIPVREVGVLGGEALAKLANERGFFAPGNVVKVMQIDAPRVTVLVQRLEGYKQALMANTPLKDEDFLRPETSEAMLEDSLAVAQATIQAHPYVTHWIVTGVNDDTAIAPLKAIEENGRIPRENTLYCGLGGYSMSVEEFKKNNSSYICIVLDPYMEGYRAMEILYNYIVNGTAMPMQTLVNGNIATLSNWKTLIDESQ
ncbi:MAG: substrate-binding domain-containing protein [Treponema sp.]|jgi:L-arabinose transport system substrate-binding protein|nr:substrate-binding domain-containing protein [Treponema sp.]